MKLSPTGKPFDQTHRHGEVRIAGDRRQAARAAARNLVAVDRVDLPRRRHGRPDQRDDIVLLRAAGRCRSGPAARKLICARFLVRGSSSPLVFSRLLERLLPEQRHLLRACALC